MTAAEADYRNTLEAIDRDPAMPEHYIRRLVADCLRRHPTDRPRGRR